MKKILVAMMVIVMVLAMASCGGGSEEGGDAGTPPVTSKGEIISVVLPDGFVDSAIGDYYETVTIQPEGAEGQNANYIEIMAPDSNGVVEKFNFYQTVDTNPYQFAKGQPYTMDMMKSDMEIYIGLNPSIYSNMQEVTIGDYDYLRYECVTNGEDAYYYYTIVNDRPCTVSIVGGDLLVRDSEEVTKIMEGITFNPAW